jgi:polysaccharide deacetylase family protein (PEP-CTERM system associated)
MKIMTFDIEDWYCHDVKTDNLIWEDQEVRIYEGVENILSALKKNDVTATFFCLGWLAERHPDVIKIIAESGHQIGCHSYKHEIATKLTPKQFRENTYRAKTAIENVIGKPVELYRAPAFSITESNLYAFETLVELGFTTDCSVFPARRDDGGMPSYNLSEPGILVHNGMQLKEFPINPYSIVGRRIVYSGGGYFRLFPYWLIKALSERQDYIMSYLHPSDFDPDQPKMDYLPAWNRWKNRVGLKTSYDKFCKYLNDFEFISIEEADKMIEWEQCNKIVL